MYFTMTETMTTKPSEESSPTIYAGLFDIQPTELGTCVNPIGIARCYPEEGAVRIVIAEEGFERQLLDVSDGKYNPPDSESAQSNQSGETKPDSLRQPLLPPEARPLDKSDGVSASAWQEIMVKEGEKPLTYVHRFPTDKNPELTPEERERLEKIERVAAHALAAVLRYEVYEEFPDKNTMHELSISDEVLNNSDGILIN